MLERRRYERFDLTLLTMVEVLTPEGKKSFNALSTNISAGGVHLYPRRPIPEGTSVKVNVTIQNERLKKRTGAQGVIITEGTIVRCTSIGIAVSFGEDYQILSLTAWEKH